MRRTPRAAISLGLSLAMALGSLPAQALADAIEDGDVVQESVTPVSDDSPIIEVPPVEAAEAESIDANEAPIEKGLVAQDETEPQEVVSAEDDSSPYAPEQDTPRVLTTQESSPTSGKFGTCRWSISGGVLTIAPAGGVRGELPDLKNPSISSWPWAVSEKSSITGVKVEGTVVCGTSVAYMFSFFPNVKSMDLSGLDTSRATDMNSMFRVDAELIELDLSRWDTSRVTNMAAMFVGCSKLRSLDLNGFDTRNVKSMSNMFGSCNALATLDISTFDTSSVEDMMSMFFRCNSLTSLDISGFHSDRVLYMGHMFDGCTSLKSLDASALSGASLIADPVTRDNLSVQGLSGGYGTYRMFAECTSLESLNLSNFDMPRDHDVDMGDMYEGCGSLALWKVGAGYRTDLDGAVPAATAAEGWWSRKASSWLSVDKVAARSGVADTYTNAPARSIAKAAIRLSTTSYTYDATAKKPVVKSVTLNGTPLVRGTDYTVSYASGRKDAGTYEVTVKGIGWYTGSAKAAFTIAKAANPITAKATKANVSVTYNPKAATVTPKNVGTSGKVGALSYANASATETTRGFEVDPATGEVTLPKATRAIAYTVKVKVTAAGNRNYEPGSKTVTYKMVVNKAANPITVTPAARTASFETLRTRAVTVTKPLAVSGSIGTKTYSRAQNSNYFTVDSATGKVTVKKGTPKGTYTLKVRVTAAGGPNYEAGSKVVTGKITVR